MKQAILTVLKVLLVFVVVLLMIGCVLIGFFCGAGIPDVPGLDAAGPDGTSG